MRVRTFATLLLMLAACFAIASDKPTPAATAFEKMKTLAGNWEGSWQGKSQTMVLQVVSGGSAVMQSDNTESMVTMFHLDGERLMMTHYCAAKNQPRMVAEVSPDGKSIAFNFLDVTNLAGSDAGHMRRMVLTFEDANHFTEQWTFRKDGKDGQPEMFRYARKQ